MSMNKRLSKLEESLKTDAKYSKYKNCEIVIRVGEDNSNGGDSCCVRFPDGDEEFVTDLEVIRYLEDIDDSITVEIVD